MKTAARNVCISSRYKSSALGPTFDYILKTALKATKMGDFNKRALFAYMTLLKNLFLFFTGIFIRAVYEKRMKERMIENTKTR